MRAIHNPVLYLASTNSGKLREFREAASRRGITVEALPGIAGMAPCVEDGATFEENACQKARYYSTLAPGLVFADDSGICADALGGGPGIYSARFAGPGASDEANNAKLIESLAPFTAGQRAAHYVCVIALAEAGRIAAVTEGRADGVILAAPRGAGGFGYDPFFLFPALGLTFAELSPESKFGVSHRGEAFRKLLDRVEEAGDRRESKVES
ncbi:MAG: RdgB/HAM1 family non-canonical purine NTP pyrophosphatase [Terriglobia bacterium]